MVAASPEDRGRRYAIIGGVAAVALVLLTVAAVVGGFLGDKRGLLPEGSPAAAVPPAASPGSGAIGDLTPIPAASEAFPSGPAASPGASPPGGDARFRCELQSHVAPAAGAWQVFGARYGVRGGFDYLQLNLRRRGGSDETGSVTAELVPLGEVESRFGVEPPESGDLALIVVFDGPVRLSGSFGRSPNQRALREFRLARTPTGTTAVLGVAAPGCFELLAPGWSDGAGARAAVIVNVQR